MIYLTAFFVLSATFGYWLGHWRASAAAKERENRIHRIYQHEMEIV